MEVYVAIIAGSIPIVRAMAVRYFAQKNEATISEGSSVEELSKGSQKSRYSDGVSDMESGVDYSDKSGGSVSRSYEVNISSGYINNDMCGRAF